MRYVYSFCRLILGLFFFILGIDGFLGFLPDLSTSLVFQEFTSALATTGYFLSAFYGVEIVMASLLLLNLGVLLAALVLGVVLIHSFLMYYLLIGSDLQSLEMMVIYLLLLLNLILIISKRRALLALLR